MVGGPSHQLLQSDFFYLITPSMRKVYYGGENKVMTEIVATTVVAS